jgi:hypothetical protein
LATVPDNEGVAVGLLKKLNIDLGELCDALEDGSHEHEYYLDLETGDILMVSDWMDTEEAEGIRDRIDAEPERYEALPRVGSHEGYRDMEEFIEIVAHQHLRDSLEVAINGKGAFRRFKDVLARYPEAQEEWFRFKDDRLMERALEWLEDIGIEPI